MATAYPLFWADSAIPRDIRAYLFHPSIPRRNTKNTRLFPKNAMTRRARIMNGSEYWKSTIIMIASSTQPRKCAATNPRAVPNTAVIIVPQNATRRLVRIDLIRRLNKSRPSESVPRKWTVSVPPKIFGMERRFARSCSS